MDEAFAADCLREQFGLDGVLEPLPGERDRNFAVDATDGQRYVLKFTNSAQPPGSVEMQTLAMERLADSIPELPMPRIVPCASGASSIQLTLPCGSRHVVRLMTWLDGIPMDEAGSTANLAQPIGHWLARIDRVLRDFTNPGAVYPLLWDVRNAAHLRDLLGHIEDESLRQRCVRCLDRIEQHMLPALGHLPRQVIFGDLHPGNVLVRTDDPERLAGLIDFGDMVHSHRIIDVAVAGAYFCRAGENPFEPVVDLLRSYTSVNPLEATEIELLPDLIMARLLTTTMIAHWRASMFPGNREYIMCSVNHSRSMLACMSPSALDLGRAQFLAEIPTLEQAAGHGA